MAKTMTEGLRAQVISQNEALHRPQLELFLQEQARIAAPKTDLPLPPFGCSQCPFLIEGMCTIYPVRPAICRAYGYFTWRRGPDQGSQVFACQMAAETLLDSLRSQGTETLAMPVWNRFQEKLYALNGEGAMIATLPLWLLAHTGTRETFLPTLNPAPNFEALREQT
jgi:Fe-S-cluster containining protein